MPSHHASSSSSNINTRRSASPPRARIFHACKSCAASKVKCHDLRTDGCARCRRRKTACSLAGLPGIEDGPPERRRSEDMHTRRDAYDHGFAPNTSISTSFPDPTTHPYQSAPATDVQEMRQRIQQLESAYNGLLTSISPTRSTSSNDVYHNPLVPTITPPVTNVHSTPHSIPSGSSVPLAASAPKEFLVQHRTLDVDGFKKSYTMEPANLIFDERCRCAVDPNGYPNIITRGHVTRSHVEGNFQLFKHRFSLIAPMIPFLLTTRSIPTHPFIVLAALAFLHDPLPLSAVGMIEESILYAMSGPACVEAIMALYILTFAPYPPGSQNHVPPTSLRMISLAYSMGVDLGMETKAEVALSEDSQAEELVGNWAADRLEEMTLWEAVKNRYCILQMETARCSVLPTLRSHRFPTHPSDHANHCISHLQLEARIVEGCREFVKAVGMTEVIVKYSWPDIIDLSMLWSKTQSHLDGIAETLDDDQWLLRCTITCLTYSLGFRLGFAFYKPPSPISISNIEQSEALTALSLIPPSSHIIEDTIPFLMSKMNRDQDDGETFHLPAFLITTITICLATSRRVAMLTKFTVPEPLFDESLLLKAENFVGRQPGLPGKVLREMWTSLSLSIPFKEGQNRNRDSAQGETGNNQSNHQSMENHGDFGHIRSPNEGPVPSLWSVEEGFNWDIFNFDFLFADNSLIPNPNLGGGT
ncbi:hypothetical protein I302_107198 [Kwoniella bestiolae CBS 10118]|uniref:Zn(2)-C6 fungal-type domain-containing protein n=1 Tax=Kwoniella bestiolae CBS 10118 TaxID=1296100 RepID=A0A1B9FZ82_9TREE|nr:hypothetical protein I302_05536 [Kwoniella bestiolae CBS 10118]OCF24079.1 hypothetical protein I302_05536 [Kwoniella bestiolae CBS 10118]